MNIILWIQSHYVEVIQIVLQLIGAASLIVRFTPTSKDDDFFNKLREFIAKYVALNPPK